jgi:type II secretory pathway component PulF
MENRRLIRTQLVTALFYPVLVFVSAISVAAFIVFYLIPKLKAFLSAFGKKLPAITQSLIDVTEFFDRNGLPLALGAIALTGAAVALYLWPPGRLFADRLLLRLPVVGGLFRLSATAVFARSTGVLLRSGVTLVESLRTVEGLFRNRHLAGIVHRARERIITGGMLGSALAEPKAFTPMLGKMVAVGEMSGALDDILDEIAKFHESQLQSAIRRFSAFVEPVIIIVVGSIVGFVYIAFFMALFSVAGGGR